VRSPRRAPDTPQSRALQPHSPRATERMATTARVAACLLPALYTASVDAVAPLSSCSTQRHCIQWTMEPAAEQECSGEPVSNEAGQVCPSMWKVCMTVQKKAAGNECPELFVRSHCPNPVCPTSAAAKSPVVVPAYLQCGDPLLTGEEYCQFGASGAVLRFVLQDGDGCTEDDDSVRPQHPSQSLPSCQALVQCKAATLQDHVCKSGCNGAVGNTPCVHTFRVPADKTEACGCEDTTTTTTEEQEETTTTTSPEAGPKSEPEDTTTTALEAESMPEGAVDPLNMNLGLAAFSKAPAAVTSSSMLAMAGALCFASAAAIGAFVYRRLGAAPNVEEAREMEPLEVGLAE